LVTELAVDLQLRNAQASYVAVAQQLQIPLVSWDQQHQERTAGRIVIHMP
jgi:predicted nucleic acid-binding protein